MGGSAILPDAVQKQFAEFDLSDISQFIAGAFAAYRRKHYGDVVWVRELESFTVEEKERLPLASVDLYFKIDEALDEDPTCDNGQALAARWMELIESRTGGHPDMKASYESYTRWMNDWPSAIHQRIKTLSLEKISEFILKAMARPMKL
jgi:hypothetical protein